MSNFFMELVIYIESYVCVRLAIDLDYFRAISLNIRVIIVTNKTSTAPINVTYNL